MKNKNEITISQKKWTNRILYWSWDHSPEFDAEGYELRLPPTPSTKTIDYARSFVMQRTDESKSNYVAESKQITLAIGVWDDDRYTPLNRSELDRHLTTYCFDVDQDKPLHAVVVRKSSETRT